jgi:FtsZ-binding cell division protein ZapB
MKKRIRKFCSLLQIELEDLKEDVNSSIQLSGYKHKQDEISEKIYRENLTVYQSELRAFKEFGKILSTIKNKNFESIPEISKHLKAKYIETIKDSGFVERAMFYIDRKFNKILKYMDEGCD